MRARIVIAFGSTRRHGDAEMLDVNELRSTLAKVSRLGAKYRGKGLTEQSDGGLPVALGDLPR